MERAFPLYVLCYLVAIVMVLGFLFGLIGCVQTTTTAPDGTVTTTKAPAPGVLPFAAAALQAYSPRPIVVVREEKSGPMRCHLQGWQGRMEMAHHVKANTDRISKEEIERRRRQLFLAPAFH